MKASQKLINKIKEFEGCKLFAYRDSGVGVLTIGYGHTRGVKAGMAITQKQAENFLLEDISIEEGNLNRSGLNLTQGQFDALLDWCYNVKGGYYRLTHGNDGKPTTLYNKIVSNAPTAEIQAQFRRWVYAGSKKLPGLVKRREWEAKRWAETE